MFFYYSLNSLNSISRVSSYIEGSRVSAEGKFSELI